MESRMNKRPMLQVSNLHIIKPRSIDLNNVYGAMYEPRLSANVQPTGYKLELEPYLEDALFKGRVSINVTFQKDLKEIELYCDRQLKIISYDVKKFTKEATNVSVERLWMDPKRPILRMDLKEVLPQKTEACLEFSFSGKMETSNNEAFFKTTYVENEVERIVAATQFRPSYARRLFPCFDEPRFKAPFELSVVKPKNMVALSNTPIDRIEDIPEEPNAVWVHFQRTPPMATYSLGLVMAELDQLTPTTVYKYKNEKVTALQVWGRPEYLSAIADVNEKLAAVFHKLATTWGEPLPLPTLNVVALPNFKGVKPIDSWGLIVFKESDLASKGYMLLAQEVSYQWMGGLVSPAWWSEVYLNKALNSYLAATTVFKINNGTEMEGKWPMTMLYSLYYEYSKRYPHSRITGMKHETASTKIELLLRMLSYTVGEAVFTNGLRRLIDSKKFGTFGEEDLWYAINYEVELHGSRYYKNIQIKNITRSWIERDRLPLLTAIRDYTKNECQLTQKVYLRERPHDVPGAESMVWWLPIVLAREDQLNRIQNVTNLLIDWIPYTKSNKLHNMPDEKQFIILNPEEVGPFPVNYDVKNWKLLSDFLYSEKRTMIPVLTRAKLLHDAWNLAYAGELSFAVALDMTLFLKNERNHLVWDPVFTMIDHIGRIIPTTWLWRFEVYVRSMLHPLYKDLMEDQREDEENWRQTLRTMTKNFLCQVGYKPCIAEAQEQFSKWTQAVNPDEGTLISNQYICPVFKYGTTEEWEFGLQRVLNFPPSRRQSERTYLLKSLAGCPKDEYKINRLLNITLLEGNGNFTETDLFLVFTMLAGSNHGSAALFQFLDRNWDVLQEKYRNRTNLWDNLITSAVSSFKTEEGLGMLSSLYMAHTREFASAEHIIESAMRKTREEAKWSAENLPDIDKWLKTYIDESDVEEFL